jgi:ABC-type lipoprotein release transport system permease subunit
MIAAILITVLVLFLLGVWFLVFVIDVMSSIRKACDTYIEQARTKTVVTPPEPPTSPHSVWRTKGPGGQGT